jgi:predicted transcriptional regulator
MKKELNEEEKEITKTVVDKLSGDDKTKELTSLMRECGVSDEIIMLSLFGIGSHTEYYNVLINRINKNKDIVNDEWIKKEVSNIFHEIDRNEDS